MSVAKTISFTLFFISIIAIVYSLTKAYNQCPLPKIEYKYIKRSFNEEQDNPTEIKKIFGSMFDQPSPWVGYTDRDLLESNKSN
jgi:hypothetical protein